MQMDRRFMFMKKLTPGGCLHLPYINVYDHNIQTSSLKPLGRIKGKLYVEHRYIGGMKLCIKCQGHMTRMAAMAINSKNI